MSQLRTNKNYYLLLIDIRKSTSLPSAKRKQVFKKLDGKLKDLNRRLCPSALLNLSVSYGDEIAGLFEKPHQFYDIVCQIREELSPEARFRFAASYGKIGVVSKDIREVGGEVFKEADNLIRRLKKQDGFCIWSLKNPEMNDILNSLTEMSNTILERMTPYQRIVWQLLEQGLTQKEIAKRLKKFPQSVSNAVKRGRADQVLRAGEVINHILESY